MLDAIWPNVVVEENNLNQCISTLRRVLGERPTEHRFLVTEPGRGYRFVASVAVVADEAPGVEKPAIAESRRTHHGTQCPTETVETLVRRVRDTCRLGPWARVVLAIWLWKCRRRPGVRRRGRASLTGLRARGFAELRGGAAFPTPALTRSRLTLPTA